MCLLLYFKTMYLWNFVTHMEVYKDYIDIEM